MALSRGREPADQTDGAGQCDQLPLTSGDDRRICLVCVEGAGGMHLHSPRDSRCTSRLRRDVGGERARDDELSTMHHKAALQCPIRPIRFYLSDQ